MTTDQVVCTCINTINKNDSDDVLNLRNLLRNSMSGVYLTQQVQWLDHTNCGIEISSDHKTLSKNSVSSEAWDKIARSHIPLTKGLNILEFKINARPPTFMPAMVVGVHPTNDCKAGFCEPGLHVSSVGVAFHVVASGNTTHGHNTGFDTSWMMGQRVRVEVDFIQDKIRFYADDILKMENAETHAPSMMPGSYFTFMISAPSCAIEILRSSVTV